MTGFEVTIPVGGMPVGALPPPARVRHVPGATVQYPDSSSANVLLARRPDAQVAPDRWELQYQNLPAAAANAVRAHQRDHGRRSWTWHNPLTGVDETVRHVGAPEITWHGRLSVADVRLTLERAATYR